MAPSSAILMTVVALAADLAPRFDADIAPLLKRHCVKCHGPVTAEARLNLSMPSGVLRGGESGAAIVPHDLEGSLLWKRISADEMPPEDPLSADEKKLLRTWIEGGAPGLPAAAELAATGDGHWAFQRLAMPAVPPVRQPGRVRNVIDQFIEADLEHDDLSLAADAERHTLVRRIYYDLIGLPPTEGEIDDFVRDGSPDAVERLADRLLASPRYGERFGKVWLDAAGYADSNGYFNADTDRPLAYRYRDYVIRAFNDDKPFDRFVCEQLAGDELVEWSPATPVTPEVFEALVATHYLRNGQDGTGESDGNPEEVRADRYYAIEGTMQNVATSLLGLTIQCAKCHEHKFEPIPHKEYYQFQAVFAGVFHHENWITPNERFVVAPIDSEKEAWDREVAAAEAAFTQAQSVLASWLADHRPRGTVVFHDAFDGPAESLAERWSPTAPTDDAPGGEPVVAVDSDAAPGARVRNGRLELLESAAPGNRWLVTRQAFDWTPDEAGGVIQVTFDLVDRRVDLNGAPAERTAYYLAAHDFDDSSSTPGGNILVDGNPGGSTAVFLDYPGEDQQQIGEIGTTPYTEGRNYGVRITHQPDGQFLLEHLVDGVPEDKTLTFAADQLPNGGFGFEFCCGRSFIVDNVKVETFTEPRDKASIADFVEQVRPFRKAVDEASQRLAALKNNPPGKIAWAVDLTPTPPAVQWLNRGDYGSPKEPVDAGPFSALAEDDNPWPDADAMRTSRTTGRRLAWAAWVTRPGSRAAALLARVQANRVWQHHFGFGIVATPDNFGLSGSPPTHPALLDWLAGEFVRADWSVKSLHRRIVSSRAYQQSSIASEPALTADRDGRRYSRFPVRRLDAEAIRDTLLHLSGRLDDRLYGPYVRTDRAGNGEVIVPEGQPGFGRRSVYLYQRRTQVLSLLQIFDAPSIVFNSVRRTPTTIPLQSLNLLNSEFVVNRMGEFTVRLFDGDRTDEGRLDAAFLQLWGRRPTESELAAAKEFLALQAAERGGTSDAVRQAWIDLNQMLFAASAALYVE
jgi:hypothetical protein